MAFKSLHGNPGSLFLHCVLQICALRSGLMSNSLFPSFVVSAISAALNTIYSRVSAPSSEISAFTAFSGGWFASVVLNGLLAPVVGVGLSSFRSDSSESRSPFKCLGSILLEKWGQCVSVCLDCLLAPSDFSAHVILRGPEHLAEYLDVYFCYRFWILLMMFVAYQYCNCYQNSYASLSLLDSQAHHTILGMDTVPCCGPP